MRRCRKTQQPRHEQVHEQCRQRKRDESIAIRAHERDREQQRANLLQTEVLMRP